MTFKENALVVFLLGHFAPLAESSNVKLVLTSWRTNGGCIVNWLETEGTHFSVEALWVV